jgi:hypothetical protein
MIHEEFGKFLLVGVLGGKQLERRGLGPAFENTRFENLNDVKF